MSVDLTNAILRPCQGCRRLVYWIKSKKGRWTPYNENGVYHGLTCPKSKRRRQYLERETMPRS
jgi:hypothetical protein